MTAGVSVDEEQLETEIVLAVREHVGPVASFRLAIAIKKLPKTRSGKVARKTMASMITRKPYNVSNFHHVSACSNGFIVLSVRCSLVSSFF